MNKKKPFFITNKKKEYLIHLMIFFLEKKGYFSKSIEPERSIDFFFICWKH